MEQKKTLWIIAATGLFLLVVIGAAIILYSPGNNPTPVIASVPVPPQTPSGGWTMPLQPSDNQENSALSQNEGRFDSTFTQPEKQADADNIQHIQELTVISGKTNVYEITAPESAKDADLNAQNTIDLNSLKSAAEEIKAGSKTVKSVEKVAKTTAKTEQNSQASAKPVTKTASAKTTVQNAAAKTSSSVAPRFWVQAGAFASKKSADNARTVLAENKIPAEVFTYTDAKKQVFYRVRVGPYTTKTEASFWKEKILKIDQFKDSKAYVTDSSASK